MFTLRSEGQRDGTRTWADKSGVAHKTTEIIAENMELGPRPATPAAAQSQEAKAASTAQPGLIPDTEDGECKGRGFQHAMGEDAEIKPEDIPF